jgi:hypothetical protein
METKEKKVPKKRTGKKKSVETAMISPYSSAQLAYRNTMNKLFNAGS